MQLSWGPEIMMMEVEPETLKKNPASDKVDKKAKRYFFVVFFKIRQTSQCLWVHYFYIYRYAYKSRYIDVTLFIIHLFFYIYALVCSLFLNYC